MTTATCHTEDCGNAEIPLDVGDLSAPDPFGMPWTAPTVVCGACGVVIDDLAPTPTNPDLPGEDSAQHGGDDDGTGGDG